MPGTRGTYRRVLLKLSGEVFGGAKGIGVDPDVVQDIAKQIADVARTGVQVAIVVGGGNYFRGAELSQRGMDRSRADYMGMLGCTNPRPDCNHNGSSCRALHSIARYSSS
jgi:uridylate kinase